MEETNIVAIPGILSAVVFDKEGKVLFNFGNNKSDLQIHGLFRTFGNIHRQRCKSKGRLRVGLSEDVFLCSVSASGDIVGKSESSLKSMLVLFRKDRVIFFVGEYNSRISYMRLIDEVLEIRRNIDVLFYSVTAFAGRYTG